ncbi:hypothetical protein DS608_21670 [Salmonella enterica subsp. enterica serovar Javiana]|nr:hypothetical protein [Salmonella enterica subsp. enterica serovar Javiana]
MFISTGWLITIALIIVYFFYKNEMAHYRQIGRLSIENNALRQKVDSIECDKEGYERTISILEETQDQSIDSAYERGIELGKLVGRYLLEGDQRLGIEQEDFTDTEKAEIHFYFAKLEHDLDKLQVKKS